MKQPLVTVSVIHYSETDGFSTIGYLRPFLTNLRKQTYDHIEVFCIDNASSDKRYVEILKDFPEVTVIELDQNMGTCAHNEVISQAKGDYVWCVTLDTEFDKHYLKRIVTAAEALPQGGSFGGTLFQWDCKHIDTQGTQASPSHYFSERHRDLVASKETLPDQPEAVFGISGASVVFRNQALQHIRDQDGHAFDEAYFMYKEDVDIAYRLLWAGYKNYQIPHAFGRHVRTTKDVAISRFRNLTILKSRKQKSPMNRYLSIRNHLYLLYKNYSKDYGVYTHLRTIFDEVRRFVWVVIFETKQLRAYRDFWKTRKKLPIIRRSITASEVEKSLYIT